MHKLTRIALVGTSPAVAARVKAALEGRGSARDCDPIALVGPVGAPLTYTDDQAARNALRDFGYREMMQPGMVVPLVGLAGDAAAPLECDKCGKRFEGAHAGVDCPKCGSDETMLRTSY